MADSADSKDEGKPAGKKKGKGKAKAAPKGPQPEGGKPKPSLFFLLLDFLVFGGAVALCVLIFLKF
jgi:hypothetical protein